MVRVRLELLFTCNMDLVSLIGRWDPPPPTHLIGHKLRKCFVQIHTLANNEVHNGGCNCCAGVSNICTICCAFFEVAKWASNAV